jgi:hypothetical protein
MIEKIKLDCYWCERQFYTEVGRIYHLYRQHPRFFEEYDKVNSWIGCQTILEKPKYFRCSKCEFETDDHRKVFEHVHTHTDKELEDENYFSEIEDLIDYSDEFKNMNQQEQLRELKTVPEKNLGDKNED